MLIKKIYYTGYVTKIRKKTFNVEMLKHEDNNKIKYHTTFKISSLTEHQKNSYLVLGATFEIIQLKTKLKLKFCTAKKITKKEFKKIEIEVKEMAKLNKPR